MPPHKFDLDSFKKVRVAVIGDVMIDSWIEGTVARISPEAPVPVVTVDQTTHVLGGAANVARNLASLGATVDLFGVIGDDSWGTQYVNMVHAESLIHDHSVVVVSRPTTVKSRIVGNHQQIVRLDQESQQNICVVIMNQLMQSVRSVVAECDCVIVSDYAKGVITAELMQELQMEVGQHEIPVLVDPKRADWKLYEGSSLLTPNRSEFSAAAKVSQQSDQHMVHSAQHMILQHNLGAVLITLAHDGMLLVSADAHVHLPAHRREVADVSGAGDTVMAVMALAHCAGLNWSEAAHMANIAAGISVSKSGTATVLPQELATHL